MYLVSLVSSVVGFGLGALKYCALAHISDHCKAALFNYFLLVTCTWSWISLVPFRFYDCMILHLLNDVYPRVSLFDDCTRRWFHLAKSFLHFTTLYTINVLNMFNITAVTPKGYVDQ